jgi:hypothetical protein
MNERRNPPKKKTRTPKEAKEQEVYQHHAGTLLKNIISHADLTYAKVAEKMGESESSVAHKIMRGTFQFSYLLKLLDKCDLEFVARKKHEGIIDPTLKKGKS